MGQKRNSVKVIVESLHKYNHKGEFPTINLHNIKLNSNPKVKMKNNGSQLIVDTDMLLVAEFLVVTQHFDEHAIRLKKVG